MWPNFFIPSFISRKMHTSNCIQLIIWTLGGFSRTLFCMQGVFVLTFCWRMWRNAFTGSYVLHKSALYFNEIVVTHCG